jgi:methionyl-tRNA formyltransferase
MSSKKTTRLNYVFFGTPDFAAIILQNLIDAGFLPAAVVCNPDRPAGRKKIITPPPTKVLAEKHNIKVYQPENLEIGNWENADFGIVASYGKIIPEKIIQTFKLGMIGVHPSLLPRHRGASPIQSAILSGDEVTGVTLYLLDEKMDHGPILAGKELKIEKNDNYETLSEKLAILGAELTIKTIPEYIAGKSKPQVQNEEYATYTKKFKTEDAYVNLEKDDPVTIERKIRALNPEPGVWTLRQGLRVSLSRTPQGKPFDKAQGKRMKILEAEIEDGKLKLKKIQFEGKKPQTC